MRTANAQARLLPVLLAVGIAAPATAQSPDAPFGPMIMEEIIVTAPRILRREQVDRTSGGGRVEQITLTRRVSFADLDLRMHADVVELERRIAVMAEEACSTIAEVYRFVDPEPSHAQCTEQAVAGAMRQVDAAVEAAAE